jgi:hypothetical protein
VVIPKKEFRSIIRKFEDFESNNKLNGEDINNFRNLIKELKKFDA